MDNFESEIEDFTRYYKLFYKEDRIHVEIHKEFDDKVSIVIWYSNGYHANKDYYKLEICNKSRTWKICNDEEIVKSFYRDRILNKLF